MVGGVGYLLRFRAGRTLPRLRCFAKPLMGLRLTKKDHRVIVGLFRPDCVSAFRSVPFPGRQCNDATHRVIIFPCTVPLQLNDKTAVFAEEAKACFVEAQFVEVRLLRVTRQLHLPRVALRNRDVHVSNIICLRSRICLQRMF